QVLHLVEGGDDDQHPLRGHRPLLRRRCTNSRATATAPSPSAVSAHSGASPSRSATVAESRWAMSSTKTAGVNSVDERTTVPSGAMIAEMPLVAAIATVRPY